MFAEDKGDRYVSAARALEWASKGSTPLSRGIRLRTISSFAAFLRAEDPRHESPPTGLYPTKTQRQSPYIYSPHEIAGLLDAAGRLHRTYPLRRETYQTLLGLIACTGLRISEALDLELGDIEPDEATLVVRDGKFGKARRVPLHVTAADALRRYVDARGAMNVPSRHLFLSAGGRRISRSMANDTFRTVAALAGIETGRARPCRIHDLRIPLPPDLSKLAR
jgi:integrase/recombinase XerD